MIIKPSPVLPPSFKASGFISPEDARRVISSTGKKLRRLMIGTDGPSDSGKTEFALSAPGPIADIGLDRGIDGVLDNPNPPDTRCRSVGICTIKVPLVTQLPIGGAQNPGVNYLPYWQAFYEKFRAATDNPDVRTVVIDGDSDSWELQKLAEFGKLTQIPPIMYTNVNAARRAMYARAYDSGKIVIATNKVKNDYMDDTDKDGNVVYDTSGKPKQVRSGEYARQGFPDQNYLFMIQLRHMYHPESFNKATGKVIPAAYGIRIMKCKSDMSLVGHELWGSDCNFRGLVETVYPNVDPIEWGF